MSYTEQKIKEVLAKVLGLDVSVIEDDATADGMEEWDSLRHLNLVLALEQTFNVEFEEEEVVEMLSIPLIRAVLEEHDVRFVD